MLYSRLSFTTELSASASLPLFKGSTFRGAFGNALKRVACALERQECQSCLLASRCVYPFFFERKAACAKKGLRLPSPPHPFVIEPPLTTEVNFNPGDSFDFNLILFGRANDYLPYCIYAFEQMGRVGIGKRINGVRAGFVLKTVSSESGKIIYSSQDQRLIREDEFAVQLKLQKPEKEKVSRLTVYLKTPLRIKHENRLLRSDLPFHVLIRAALRRISSLFACYGQGDEDKLALDYRGLVARAQDQSIRVEESDLCWFDWSRYSSRQDTKMLMGGMLGSISYWSERGNLGEFLALLRLGEKVHLGKQSTFGLGQIMVEAE